MRWKVAGKGCAIGEDPSAESTFERRPQGQEWREKSWRKNAPGRGSSKMQEQKRLGAFRNREAEPESSEESDLG